MRPKPINVICVPLRRHSARRTRSSLLCCPTDRPANGWNQINRASTKPRAIHKEAIRLGYGYDKTSNVTRAERTVGGETQTREHTYDQASRLTKTVASTGVTDTYTYDRNGNRTGWQTNDAPDTPEAGDGLSVTSTFNQADQLTASQLARTDSTVGSARVGFVHDANGNQNQRTVTTDESRTETRYRYDAADRLANISRPGYETGWVLDGAGRCTETETVTPDGTIDTSTVFAGIDPLETVNQTSGETRSLLGGLDISDLGGTDWQLMDQLGSVIATTSLTGQTTGLAEYSDFGVTATTSDWDPLVGYTGELADPTAGLDLFYRRAYDPTTGNWTQADPYRGLIDEPQTLNRYAYVQNNPATLWDYAGFSADAADRYGSGAQSYFNSQHKAPKKRKRKYRVTHSADSAEKWTSKGHYDGGAVPKGKRKKKKPPKCGYACRKSGVSARGPRGKSSNRHGDGFCWLGHNPDGSCRGHNSLLNLNEHWRGALQVGIFVAAVVGGVACAASVVCGVAVGASAGAGSYLAGRNWAGDGSIKVVVFRRERKLLRPRRADISLAWSMAVFRRV